MKLDKNTKKYIKAGDILKFSDSEQYIVTLAIEDNRSRLNVTIQDMKTKQYIYMYPVYKLYGSEIIKGEI